MLTLAACAALAAGAARAQPTPCRGDPLAPANTPTLQLDATSRPDGSAAAYGSLQYHRAPGLGPRDIALTVDDGPNGLVTPQILRILARHCLKTTFFVVGVYAQARPDLVRQEAEAGHYIGVHTWSHPNNLRRLSPDEAHREITRGFDAVETILSAEGPAAQKQMAPFFRFPGLNDSASLRAWLGSRHVAVVGADFGADDWKGIDPAQIQRRALQMAAAVGGGILILHDTKPHTAETLSSLITAFERRGYRFVQLVPAQDARDHTGSAAPLQ